MELPATSGPDRSRSVVDEPCFDERRHPTPLAEEPCTAVSFARLVWSVGAAAREAGLVVPGFRDVPEGAGRHLRRRPGQLPVVVLAVRGRAWDAVRADVVAGVLAANREADPSALGAFSRVMSVPPRPAASAAA